MSLLDTALSFAGYIPEPFIAPIPSEGTVEVYNFQNGVPLHFIVQNVKVGWYELKPMRNRAGVEKQANVVDIVNYLEELPRFYVIACIPTGEQEWLVVPFNGSDASQRGWKDAQPRKMYICNEKIEPYDLIVARSLGSILLYDQPDMRLSAGESLNTRDWMNAHNIIEEWYRKAEIEARKALIKTNLDNIQDKMKFLLSFMGASLVSAEKKGNGYKVIWQAPDGHTYKMGVREDGRISVAGFCLSGTDSQHNLSSIVQVMEEAHVRERPDVHRAYADYDEEDE